MGNLYYLKYTFTFDPEGNRIDTSVVRLPREPDFCYILRVGATDYRLSPRGLAVQKFEENGSTDLIRVLAYDRWRELQYNDGYLEEAYS